MHISSEFSAPIGKHRQAGSANQIHDQRVLLAGEATPCAQNAKVVGQTIAPALDGSWAKYGWDRSAPDSKAATSATADKSFGGVAGLVAMLGSGRAGLRRFDRLKADCKR